MARPMFAINATDDEPNFDALFLTTIGRRFHPNVLSQIVREYLDGGDKISLFTCCVIQRLRLC